MNYLKMGKFFNKKCVYNDIKFDSKKEMEFYLFLLNTYKAEEIEVHPKFSLVPHFQRHGQKIRGCSYISDFQIGDEVLDVKNSEKWLTPEFKIKFKFAKYLYPDLKFKIVVKKGKEWIKI